MTLEQIRAALPTHIMLTPGVHRWREGDEFFVHRWTLKDSFIGHPVGEWEAGRRPIPPHILDNQAWWVCANRKLGQGRVLVLDWTVNQSEAQGHSKLSQLSSGEIAVLGGADKVLKRLSEGRLYDKWLLEQMEGL